MRKVRLNSSIPQDVRQKILKDIHIVDNGIEFIKMCVAQPAEGAIDSIKQTLVYILATVKDLTNYVGAQSINSARLPVGGAQTDVDAEFLEEVSSIIGLEDGQSIDLSRAQLLYNEDTMELILTDEEEVPDGYDVVGVVTETPATDDSNEDDDDEEDKEPKNAESADKETTENNSTEEQPAEPKTESAAPSEESEEF